MYQAPRGTTDVLPEEQAYWRFVREKAVSICQLYGYERIDGPVFEDTRLFTRSVGEGTDIVEKEMYTFADQGGNKLTLRPEGTASVCRAYLEHGMQNLPQPVKLYYLASVFRYERPQAGRYREHHQFGCEAIGEADPALDAEVIDMAAGLFTSLGLEHISLHLNSIGDKNCRPGFLQVLRDYYAAHAEELCADCRKRLERNPLRLLDCKQSACQRLAGFAPRSVDYLCRDCAEHFERLKAYLGALEIPFVINPRLVRGLDYYTRTVFEIQPEVEGAQSTLCGGGRYDGLIEELGGKPAPAIGFAAGIERVVLNLKTYNVPVPPVPRPGVFIAWVGEASRTEAVRLAAELRRSGIGAFQGLGGRSLKAQLRQADALGVRHTVIIGEKEIAGGMAVIRDMATAEQRAVPREQLPGALR